MAEPGPSAAVAATVASSPSPGGPSQTQFPRPNISLLHPSQKKRSRTSRFFRVFRSVCRSFPIFTPKCKISSAPVCLPETRRNLSGTRVTGTLFGYRKGRVSLSLQETPKCLPTIVLELAMQTQVLLREMSSGMVRIALECEKRREKDKSKLLDEPLWTLFWNGKKNGYGVKREATEEDLALMELLCAVSMGAGVLPGKSETDTDGEVAYMRATFEHVVGSKDSETLYMISPEGNNGPDLTIFFVRI